MKNDMTNVLLALDNSVEVAVIDCATGKTIQEGKVCDIMKRDYSCYTVTNIIFTNNQVIMSVQASLREGKEYYFAVANTADGYSEGYSWGYVKLTPEQARAVAYACDKRNWVLYEAQGCSSGNFIIDLDNWKTTAEIDGIKE